MIRFRNAVKAIKDAQRDAEKEATRLEITNPSLAQEARNRADGLADARQIIESLADLEAALRVLRE